MRAVNRLGKLPLILVFALLFACYPYVFNCMFTLPSETKILLAGVVVFALIYAFNSRGKALPMALSVCIMAQITTWLCYSVYHADSSYITRVFFLVLTLLILSTLTINGLQYKFIQWNNNLVCLQSVLGAIAFVLFFVGALKTALVYENIDGRMGHWYYLTCTNFSLGRIMRPAGYFDEPGALAFWGIFALLFNKLFFDNKKVEIALLVSLFFTLSAAFFVQGFIYMLLFNVRSRRSMIILLVAVVTIFIVYRYFGDDASFRYLTIERFSGGEIRSERSELAEVAKGYFLQHPIFGMGARAMEETTYMSDNQYEILAKDGIVGMVVTYIPFLYLILKFRNKEVLSACFILLLGYMQRPFHVNLIHSLMLYSFMLLVILKYDRSYAPQKSVDSYRMLQRG